MATIRGVAAVANRTLVIGIVNDNATAGLFSTVTQDTAHINRRRTTSVGTCCMNIAYIIGGSNATIVSKAANAADIGITRDITCIIAAGNYRVGITAITGSTGITFDDIKSFFISQNVPIATCCLRHVNFTDDAANIGSLCRQLRLIRLSMHITAVATGFNTHRRTVQIACYTANITGDIFFVIITIVITAGDFISKAAIAFDAAGSHNIAAVVNSVQNAVILFIFIFYICCTKITGNTAYVHSTADIAFYVIGIGDIAVFSTADNTAHVACCIMVETARMIISIFIFLYQRGAYIRFVGYILQLAASTAAHNAADVGCTYLSLMSAGKRTVIILPSIFLVICMINIAVSSIAIGLDNAFVRGIINSCIGNTANDTANIIATLNSIIVNQRILRATNSRIFCFTNHAADIIRIVSAFIYTGNFAKVIGALVLDTVFLIIGQLAAVHIANQAANVANTADITGISQVRQLAAAAVRLNRTGSINKIIGKLTITLSITDDTTDIVFTADLQRTVDALDRGVHRMTDKGTGISIAALYRYAVITGNQRYIAHNCAVSKAKKACGFALAVITVINTQAKDRIVKTIKLALEGIFLRSANRSLVTARQVNRIAQGIMVPHAPTLLFADVF